MTVKGFSTYETLLKQLDKNIDDIAATAVYEGAKVIADAVRDEVEMLPIDDKWGTEGNMIYGAKEEQIKGLSDGFGISPMENEQGFLNVKIGFEGYNKLKSKRWPKGQPNAMIARTIVKGNSYTQKIPFTKKALSKSRKQSLKAAQLAIDEKIKAIEERI